MDINAVNSFSDVKSFLQKDTKISEDLLSELFSSLIANLFLVNQQNQQISLNTEVNQSSDVENTNSCQADLLNEIGIVSFLNQFKLQDKNMESILDLKNEFNLIISASKTNIENTDTNINANTNTNVNVNAIDELNMFLKELGIDEKKSDLNNSINTLLSFIEEKAEGNAYGNKNNTVNILTDKNSLDLNQDKTKNGLTKNINKNASDNLLKSTTTDTDIKDFGLNKNKQEKEINNEKIILKTSNEVKEEGKMSPQILHNSVKVDDKDALLDKNTYIIKNESDITEVIVEKFKTLKLPGFTEVRVKLKPEDLGEVVVKVVLEKGEINGNIITDKKEVANMIINQIETLKNDLKNNNINLNNISVSVASDDSYANHQNKNFSHDKRNSDKFIEFQQEDKKEMSQEGFSILV
ncbi:flagellar hook-length control protein FliK [Caloramator sp. E03]|uniref:flagellar hook-length control protein FliK n=1 Tax=Caloramator sp. E03 TaxID=2576307 RepID=UPI00143CCF48|nr:flagellar hook-length control protein FliK [Caloramator sp. E03]